MIFIIAGAAVAATFLGGLFALRFQDKLHLILGFSAGAVLGVVFFDLMPEALNLSENFFPSATIITIIALGFLSYLLLDRLHFSYPCVDEHCKRPNGRACPPMRRGDLGAGSLVFHSFLDGLAVGFAFQVSSAVGLVVAVAVLTHDFSDGINTVALVLKSGGSPRRARRWLAADALAPALGILASLFFQPPEKILGIILALFCGFFLYIGAAELLPESHHSHPTIWTTIATILGAAVIFAVVQLAGGV